MRASNEGAELSAGPTEGTPSVFSLLSDFEATYSSFLLGCTVMRIRGEISVSTGEEPATDVTDHMVAVWGIYVANRTLWGAAASGHPDPLSTDTIEAYTDWMGYGATHLIATGDATIQASGAYDGGGFYRFPVDVRARRKLDEMNSVLSLNVNSTPEQTFWNFHLSILIALP